MCVIERGRERECVCDRERVGESVCVFLYQKLDAKHADLANDIHNWAGIF